MRPRRHVGHRDREQGQGLVEMAVILPIFLLIIFGLLDVGRLVFTNSSLSQAAREGARLAAAEASWVGVTTTTSCVPDASYISDARPGAHICPLDAAAFRSHVLEAVNRMTAGVGAISALHLSCNAGDAADPAPSGMWTEASGGNGCQDGSGGANGASGDLVSVRVEYTYQVFTPLLSSMLGPLPLSGSATMVIN